MTEATKGHPRAGLIVLICVFIAALEGYDIQAFGVAAPRLVAELGLSAGQQGFAAAAAMVGLVLGAFGGGWLADRVGRKPVLTASVAAFGVFSLLTAFSHTYEFLLMARLLAGIGFGGAMANLIAVATEISAPGRRTATVTTIFCGLPAGGAAVSLIARLAGDQLDWRVFFVVGGLLPILLTPVVWRLLPETRPEPQPDADRRMLPALLGRGRAGGTLLIWAAFFLTLIVLNLMLNWLPSLVTAKGLTPGDGAAAALTFNVAGVFGALATGRMVDRFGQRWTLMAVYVALAGAMYGLAGASTLSPILAFSGVAGFLLLGAQYSLYALAPPLYPSHLRAAGSGAAVAVGRLGSVVGPLLAGELRQAGYGAGQVIAVMIPVVIAAAIATVTLSYVGKPHDE